MSLSLSRIAMWLRRVTHPREHHARLRSEAMVRHPAGKRIGKP